MLEKIYSILICCWAWEILLSLSPPSGPDWQQLAQQKYCPASLLRDKLVTALNFPTCVRWPCALTHPGIPPQTPLRGKKWTSERVNLVNGWRCRHVGPGVFPEIRVGSVREVIPFSKRCPPNSNYAIGLQFLLFYRFWIFAHLPGVWWQRPKLHHVQNSCPSPGYELDIGGLSSRPTCIHLLALPNKLWGATFYFPWHWRTNFDPSHTFVPECTHATKWTVPCQFNGGLVKPAFSSAHFSVVNMDKLTRSLKHTPDHAIVSENHTHFPFGTVTAIN